MKRMNRRQFAKMAGGAALVTPVTASVAAGFSGFRSPVDSTGVLTPDSPAQSPQQPQQAPQSPPPAEAKPKYGMSKEQEERVAQAIQRRERQNAQLRSRTLPYELEASFVFRVRTKSK
jgi:hypothetical protein